MKHVLVVLCLFTAGSALAQDGGADAGDAGDLDAGAPIDAGDLEAGDLDAGDPLDAGEEDGGPAGDGDGPDGGGEADGDGGFNPDDIELEPPPDDPIEPSDPPPDDPGCACVTAGSASALAGPLALTGLVAVRRRRRPRG